MPNSFRFSLFLLLWTALLWTALLWTALLSAPLGDDRPAGGIPRQPLARRSIDVDPVWRTLVHLG